MIANELSAVRRLRKNTQNASLALEVVGIRFTTITEFSMMMDAINPTIEMLTDIQKDLSKAVPPLLMLYLKFITYLAMY